MKRFNVTGLCVKEKHYMVDISKKINEIMKLVDEGYYFTINRARQYGKTTTLYEMEKRLQNPDSICISMSFESDSETMFEVCRERETSIGFLQKFPFRSMVV